MARIIFFKKNKIRNSGQVLIESMVAITVLTMALFGILALLTKTLAIDRAMSEKFIATYLAAEGIEIVKNLVDVNYTSEEYCAGTRAWNAGLLDGSYNFDYDTTFDYSKGGKNLIQWLKKERINPPNATSTAPLWFSKTSRVYRLFREQPDLVVTPFIRTVRIKNIPNDSGAYELAVTSIVEWTTKGERKEVRLEDHFFEWRGYGFCPS